MNNLRIYIKNSNYNPQKLRINFTRWNIGAKLVTFLLMFTAIPHLSAVAAEKVVAEEQQSPINQLLNPKELSSDTIVESEVNTSLKQRFLVSQTSDLLVQSQPVNISDSFTANVAPPNFSNSFSDDQFIFASQEVSATHENLSQDILTSPKKKTELHTKEQTPQQPHLIAQVDSSGTVGDTFGDVEKLRQELLIEPIVQPTQRPRALPGSSAGTPTGYGASFGQAYFGGGLFFPVENNKRERNDGSFGFGFGLGNSVRSVGLEININIISVGGGDGGGGFDFGDSGGVGFKLHKYFSDGTAVAVGWANPIKWGDVNKGQDIIYGVVTKAFPLQPNNPNNTMPLTISVGVGTGSYSSKGAIEANDNAPNIFASLGLRVAPQVSLISSWTGNRLNVGASLVPFWNTPIVVNAIFTDVTNNLNTGLGFSVSAGYIFRF